MPTAFVLSGGASLGAAQAGMLQALYERGVRPDLLVGTSAGALNAAFVAFRAPHVETALELQDVWRRLRRSEVFPPNPLTAGLGFLGLRDHSVSSGALRRLVEKHVRGDRIEDADIPLHLVTADVVTGEEVLLSSGPLVDAVLASAAIPGVFPPVAWDGRLLVDGGIVNNAPISHAVDLGADRVIVLPAIGPVLLSSAPRGALAAGITALARTIARRLTEDVAFYSRHVDLTVLPSPSCEGILPTDFGHAGELIQQALWSARGVISSPRPLQLMKAA
jgi:NTE family protein